MKTNSLLCLLVLSIACSAQSYKASFSMVKTFPGLQNGSGIIEPKAFALDKYNNIYSTGYFKDRRDFDPGTSVYSLNSVGNQDIFISKLDASGNFKWVVQLGSQVSDDLGKSIVTDSNCNIYITGYFTGTVDFDPGNDSFNLTSKGKKDIFLLMLDSAANFIWAKSFGGRGDDIGTSLNIDLHNNLYLGGNFSDTVDFKPGINGHKYVSRGLEDIFFLKMDIYATVLKSFRIGDTYIDNLTKLATDRDGNLFVDGVFSNNVDLDPTNGSFYRNSNAGSDGFILKMDSSSNFIFAANIGNGNFVEVYNMHVDVFGNVFMVGRFWGGMDFDPGPGTANVSSFNSGYDGFVLKLDKAGNYKWAKAIGGTYGDWTNCIATDRMGSVYIGGVYYLKTDFDPGPDSVFLSSNGLRDVYITKWDSSANFLWVKTFGGGGEDNIDCILIDSNYTIYTTGTFRDSIDFNTESGKFYVKSIGQTDMYIHTIEQCLHSEYNLNVSSCNSYTSPSGRFTWTQSGTYKDTLQSYSSCDSLITINLTVPYKSFKTHFVKICDSYTSPSGKYSWTSSGNYLDTIPNAYGCDSVITVILTIFKSTNSIHYLNICNQMISPSGKYIWTQAGIYYDTIKNKIGCDSTMEFHLKYLSSSSASIQISSCNVYQSPSKKYKWTSSGLYYDTIVNYRGCDSALQIQLTIHKSGNGISKMTACNQVSSPSGKYTWTYSGNYLDTIQDSNGCDSILNVKVTILRNSNSFRFVKACNQYTSPSGKYTWTSNGIYQDTLFNYKGCDSLIEIDLTIKRSGIKNQSIEICSGEVYKIGKHLYSISGTYVDTFVNYQSCDSLVTTNLTVKQALDISTVVNNSTITVGENNAQYQWVDCKNNYKAISNETSQSYTATKNGEYAVIVYKDKCEDTSACVSINSIGLDEILSKNYWYKLYPNPNQGFFTINLQVRSYIKVYDVLGHLVYTTQLEAGTHQQNLDTLPQGIYTMQLESELGTVKVKWVKV